MTILEMDPRIIVTIFNHQEGLAGPVGAELITLRKAVSGCPLSVSTGASQCLMQADHSWNSENLLSFPEGIVGKDKGVFCRRSVEKYFKKHQSAQFMKKKLPHVQFYNVV